MRKLVYIIVLILTISSCGSSKHVCDAYSDTNNDSDTLNSTI